MTIWYPLSVCISRSHWKRSWKGAWTAFWSTLGIVWTALRILTHYLPQAADAIPWWSLVSPAVVSAAWAYWPVLSVRCRLHGRDVWMEIRVDDILNVEGAMVVSTNSMFETRISDGSISRQSLQGQYTEKYYKDREQDLARDLRASLQDVEPLPLRDDQPPDPRQSMTYRLRWRRSERQAARFVHGCGRITSTHTTRARSSRDSIVQCFGQAVAPHWPKGRARAASTSPSCARAGHAVLIQREEMIRRNHRLLCCRTRSET